MAAEVLEDNTGQSEWLPWQLVIGSIACMFCVVFLGLKFKWFRAQLSFGEPKSSKSSEPVEGIGFKLKANPDDFQSYTVISEFAQPSVTIPQTQQNGSSNQSKINRSQSYSEEKLSLNDKNTNATSLVEKPLHTLEKNTAKSKSMQQLSAKDSTTQTKQKVRIQESTDKSGEQQDKTIAQATNPLLETHNISMRPKTNAAVVEEKPKNRNMDDDQAVEDDSYFMADNSTYSNQAASIFFGGHSLAKEPNSARSNHFRQDSDNESTGSATSA